MKYYVVIPAHNEEAHLSLTLTSLLNQSLKPEKIVVINDQSTDGTRQIAEEFQAHNVTIQVLNIESNSEHLPGSKVIKAFNRGLKFLDSHYDFIVKLDADLILPENYFETIARHFKSDDQIGIAGGFAYIEKNGQWILENLTNKDHIRGAFKSYRKKCFEDIDGLKPAMGWDTVDELLAKYCGWKVVTDPTLKVKHLKPTGAQYNTASRYKQGEAFYTLGYGLTITLIASLKLAWNKRKPLLFLDYIRGFFKAKQQQLPFLVTDEQAKFIRRYRWQKMKEKLIP